MEKLSPQWRMFRDLEAAAERGDVDAEVARRAYVQAMLSDDEKQTADEYIEALLNIGRAG